jgi:phage baseplate assembly protein V
MMQIGIVTAVDSAACKCRARFNDHGGMESWWLQVVQKKTLRDKHYWLPDIGEQVVCLLDDNADSGVILGAIFSSPDPVPVDSLDKCHIAFADGTTVEYDRGAHKMKVAVVGGTLEATADISATITSPLVTLKASVQVILDAPLTSCTGDLVVDGGISSLGTAGNTGGNISAAGRVVDGGGNTNHHSH